MATQLEQEIADKISTLTVLQVSNLVKILEERFGVSAAAATQNGVAPPYWTLFV